MITVQADVRRDSRIVVLDAAEELFAERGFFGVSVRDITDLAGLRLASVNYHFGTKENLFHAVIDRRAAAVNDDRRAMLRALDATDASAEERVRGIAHAFIAPLLDRALRGGAGWKNYCRLIAQVANSRFWASSVIAPNFDPIGKEFVEALAATFPHADEYSLQYSYQFMLGSTLYILAENGRIETMTDGRFASDDLGRISRVLLDFVVGGIMRLCPPAPPRPVDNPP